jgi:hypothetical protein
MRRPVLLRFQPRQCRSAPIRRIDPGSFQGCVPKQRRDHRLEMIPPLCCAAGKSPPRAAHLLPFPTQSRHWRPEHPAAAKPVWRLELRACAKLLTCQYGFREIGGKYRVFRRACRRVFDSPSRRGTELPKIQPRRAASRRCRASATVADDSGHDALIFPNFSPCNRVEDR